MWVGNGGKERGAQERAWRAQAKRRKGRRTTDGIFVSSCGAGCPSAPACTAAPTCRSGPLSTVHTARGEEEKHGAFLPHVTHLRSLSRRSRGRLESSARIRNEEEREAFDLNRASRSVGSCGHGGELDVCASVRLQEARPQRRAPGEITRACRFCTFPGRFGVVS